MYEKKECPSCHCIIFSDRNICPFCGYDFSSNHEPEEEEEKESCGPSNEETTALHFCPNCGKELIVRTNFCANCGYKLNETNENAQASPGSYNKNIVQGQYTPPSKNGFLAGMLAFFLGPFGFHNLYLRRYPQGIIQLLISLICPRMIGRYVDFAILGLVIVYIWSFSDFWRICNGTLLPVGRSLQITDGQVKALCIMRGLVVVGWIIIALIIFMAAI